MVTVTISGLPGSGKSTVAVLLHKKTGLMYVNSGELFRKQAQQYNMSLEDFGKFCETHPEVDKELDLQQLVLLEKGNIIVEGRIAGWLAYQHNIPAVKILIEADLDTRAKRIVSREKGSVKQRKKEILTREQSEATRYCAYYHIDVNDTSIYDMIIDSSVRSPEQIVSEILSFLDR